MNLIRYFMRFLIFVAVLLVIAATAWLARGWTQAQAQAYQEEGSGSKLVRYVDAPWRTLNPDTIEEQVLSFYLNLNRAALEQPTDPAGQPVPFHVDLGETAYSISERLQDLGLIRSASIFRLYMRLNGIDLKLEAGDFQLSPAMTAIDIAETLQNARGEDVLVRIPEGRRAEEIARLLEDEGIVSAADFLAAVRTGDTVLLGLGDYPLLQDKPAGLSFEGYLFPDTYRLPVQATPSDILRIMFDNLEEKVTEEMRAQMAASGRNFHQVLTLASIVEREAALPEERPLIASTYINRLGETCANEVFGYLAADPTAQYAMGYDPQQETWWPTVPDVKDYLEINSPYNTYLYPGLPPGPIDSPGLASIEAAIYPASTEYCYFVASSGGAHVFAKTGAEHQLNVQSYQP